MLDPLCLQEGTISSWGVDLKLQRFLKTGTDSCKARDLWVTHFVVLQNVNKIALAFTSKEIGMLFLAFISCKIQDLGHPLYGATECQQDSPGLHK